MRLRYTLPALADLDEILSYIAARSPRGALRVQARIQAVIDLLLDWPGVGSVTTDPSIRRMTTSPYPYLIFYEVAGDELIIHGGTPWCARFRDHVGIGLTLSQHSTNGAVADGGRVQIIGAMPYDPREDMRDV